MNICERIRNRRIELGLSQEELGKRLDVSKYAICKVERGDGMNMTTDRVSAFAKALDCTPAYLMGFNDDVMNDAESDFEMYSDEEYRQLWKQYSVLTEEQKASVRVLVGSYYRANI